MKKRLIKILCVLCLTLVGCERAKELVSKSIDSLSLDEQSALRLQSKYTQLGELTPLQIYQDHKKRHDQGDRRHSYDVAMVLLEGKIIEKNERKALKILEESMFDDERSKLHIFSYWVDTLNNEKFTFIFETLHKDEHVKAMSPKRYNLLAQMYENSLGTERNIQKAKEYHEIASKYGNSDSKTWLETYYKKIKHQTDVAREKSVREKLRLANMALTLKMKKAEKEKLLRAAKKRELIKKIKEEKNRSVKLRVKFETEKEGSFSKQVNDSPVNPNKPELDISIGPVPLVAKPVSKAKSVIISHQIQLSGKSSFPLEKKQTAFMKLKEIEKVKGFEAVKSEYYNLILENDSDVQEYLGQLSFEEGDYVDAVTFYFLASKDPKKLVDDKLELIISKMTREEFQLAKKNVKAWLEKIKNHDLNR